MTGGARGKVKTLDYYKREAKKLGIPSSHKSKAQLQRAISYNRSHA
jgi:hypothetical protein